MDGPETGSQQVWYCTKYLLFFKPRSLTKLTLNLFISVKLSTVVELKWHSIFLLLTVMTSQNISFQIIASRNINSQIINTSFSNHAYTLKHSEHKYSQIIASNHKILESLLELFESLLELVRIIKFSNHCNIHSKTL